MAKLFVVLSKSQDKGQCQCSVVMVEKVGSLLKLIGVEVCAQLTKNMMHLIYSQAYTYKFLIILLLC